jgi:hypothetical protein
MKRRVTAVAALVFATLPMLAAETNVVTQGRVHNLGVALTQGDAIGAMVVLNEIRAGRTNAALESLEFQIDNAIVLVAGQLDTLDGPTGRSGVEFLKMMKAYRAKHPRRIEAEIYESKEFRAVAVQTIDKAKRILSEIK